MFTMKSDTEFYCGAPVSQLAKRRPTDLAVSGLSLVRAEIFLNVNRVLLHTAFHYQPLIVLI